MALLQLTALMLVAIATIQGHNFEGFKLMSHPCCAGHISAKKGEVWIVGSDWKSGWRFNGQQFVLMPGGVANIAVSPDGWHWIAGTDNTPYRWNPTLPSESKWEHLPGGIVQVSAASKTEALGLGTNGVTYKWDESSGWVQQPGGCRWVSIGKNDERWCVGTDKKPYRWNHSTNNWQQMQGGDSAMVDAYGPGQVALLGADGSVWVWDNGGWANVPGTCARISMDDGKLYCTAADTKIYESYNKTTPTTAPTQAPTDAPGNQDTLAPGECRTYTVCAAPSQSACDI